MPSAEELLGTRVLVGVTCVDPEGDLLARFQTHGVVSEVRDDAILLTREDGRVFGLPPAPELFEQAEPGSYTLSESRESVEDPDFLVSLTVTVSDQASLADLRESGYFPPASDQAS